jgi:type II secretory pathway component PulC
MTLERSAFITFGISTLSGAVAAIVILIVVNASFLKMPGPPPQTQASVRADASQPVPAEADYQATTQRNLFRAKLEIEIPKPKSEKELEEEMLTAIVRTLSLKGVMLGQRKQDDYAVIDRGGQKGVWTYEVGEIIEKGLAVREIRKDWVKLEKDDFGVVLRLFSAVPERMTGPRVAPIAPPAPCRHQRRPDAGKEIVRQGSTTRISKALAERIKTNGAGIMSSMAVKPAPDGVQVVSVDKGSIVQKMGIAPGDTLQEVNGHRLDSTQNMSKVFEALKNATDFEVKVLR